MLTDLMNRADVGMVQGGGGAGLAAKSLQRLRVLRGIFGKKLQGDEAAEQRVFCLVNDAHPTATEQFDDAVVGDGLANHC